MARTTGKRAGPIIGLMVVLTVGGVTGCSGSEPGSKQVATLGNPAVAQAGSKQAGSTPHGTGSPLAYSECMRQHGIRNFPDPDSKGAISLDGNLVAVDSPQFKAADKACLALLPPRKAENTTQVRAAALKYTACMRKNGVPGFPDPGSDGQLQIDGATLGVDPEGTVFKAADAKCQPLLTAAAGGAPMTQQQKGPQKP